MWLKSHMTSPSFSFLPRKSRKIPVSWLHMVWATREDTQPSGNAAALYSGAVTFLWAQLITQKPLAYWHFHQNVTSLGKNLQIPHVFPSRDQTLLTTRPSQKVLSLSLAFLWNERISFFFSCFSHCMIQLRFIGKCIEMSSLSHVLFPVKNQMY